MTQRDTDTDADMTTRVTVEDAAKILKVSIDAVRKRIERGTLMSEKIDGTRYVFLDADMLGQRTPTGLYTTPTYRPS